MIENDKNNPDVDQLVLIDEANTVGVILIKMCKICVLCGLVGILILLLLFYTSFVCLNILTHVLNDSKRN